MPIYEYVCQSCGKEFEEMQRFSDAPLEQCLCDEKAPVQRKVSKSAFHLKGGGWYKDGYGSAKPESSSDSESKKSDGGSEAKKTDSTAESKNSDSSTESGAKESKPVESSKSSDSSSSSTSSSSGGKESAA